MLAKLSQFFYRQLTFTNGVIIFSLFMLFNLVIFPKFDAETQAQPLDLRMGFTQEEAMIFFNEIGEGGREKYLFVESVIDSVYPLIYTALLIFIMSSNLKKVFEKEHKALMLNLLPIIPMIFDLAENKGIISMLNVYPNVSENLALITSVMNILKWIFVGISLVFILVLWIGWGIKKWQER